MRTKKNTTASRKSGTAATATHTAGNDKAASGQESGAAAAIWAALIASPEATPATIAATVGVSRATVSRTLTAWEASGKATRTRGQRDGTHNSPDTWHPVTTAETDDTSHTSSATPAETAVPDGEAVLDHVEVPDDAPARTPRPEPSERGQVAVGALAQLAAPATASDDRGHVGNSDSEHADDHNAADGAHEGAKPADTAAPGPPSDQEPSAEEPTDAAREAAIDRVKTITSTMTDAVATIMSALDGGDMASAISGVDVMRGDLARAWQILKAGTTGRARTENTLMPGQLRDQVRAHLDANLGVALTPYQIGRKLGRSSGAVANALDRLVELGQATVAAEHPRSYTAVPVPA